MGRRPSNSRKGVVEDCEVVSVSNHRLCDRLGVQITTTMRKPFSFRHWLKCPYCGKRSVKLYRPQYSKRFACRVCHNLTYRSAQKHDARLDRLLKMPDDTLRSIIEGGNDTERRLGLRARGIKSGLLRKY